MQVLFLTNILHQNLYSPVLCYIFGLLQAVTHSDIHYTTDTLSSFFIDRKQWIFLLWKSCSLRVRCKYCFFWKSGKLVRLLLRLHAISQPQGTPKKQFQMSCINKYCKAWNNYAAADDKMRVCVFDMVLLAGRGGSAAQRFTSEFEEQLPRSRPAAPHSGHPGAGHSVTHWQTACCAPTQGTSTLTS